MKKVIKNTLSRINFKNVLIFISNIKSEEFAKFVIFIIILGFLLNILDPIQRFFIKVPVGFSLLIILVYSIKYFIKTCNNLKLEMSGNSYLFIIRKDFFSNCNSNFNYLACILMSLFFCLVSIKMDFVKINSVGIYSLTCLFGIVFLAFIGYQQYIYIQVLLWKLSLKKIDNYNRLIPESTKWFKIVSDMSNVYKNLFFILGSLFIILFLLFQPHNSIEIIFKIGMSSEYFWPLTLSWLIILFAVIILFPFSAIIRNLLINKIFQKMQENSIEYFSDISKNSKGTDQILFMDIISRISKEVKFSQNGFSKAVPIITSIVNFISITTTVLLNFKSLGYFF